MSRRHPAETVARDYRPLVKSAMAQGWTVTRGRAGHLKLTSPDGTWSTPIPGSSGSIGGLHRAITTRLRKHGLEL